MAPSQRKKAPETWGTRGMRNPRANAGRYDPNTEDLLTGKNTSEGGATSDTSIDHGSLSGLSDDDHAGYARLAGRNGGQALKGGTASGDDLTLQSTNHATKGNIHLGSSSTYDEVNDRIGIGTQSPTQKLDINGDTARIRTARTPASASATGAVGEICWDSNYIYVCVATDTWKRAAIATW